MSAALVVPSLRALAAALPAAVDALQRVGAGAAASTLHVLLNGPEEGLCGDVAGDNVPGTALAGVHRETLASAATAAVQDCEAVLRDAGTSSVHK